MLLMEPVGISFASPDDTFVHVLPASRVTWTNPSLLPAQMTPDAIGDSAIAKSAQYTSWLSGPSPGSGPCLLLSFVVRSVLMTLQLRPLSVVRCTYWLPAYAVWVSCGEIAIGAVQFIRNLRSSRETLTA